MQQAEEDIVQDTKTAAINETPYLLQFAKWASRNDQL
jgi:hypothetical protein